MRDSVIRKAIQRKYKNVAPTKKETAASHKSPFKSIPRKPLD